LHLQDHLNLKTGLLDALFDQIAWDSGNKKVYQVDVAAG
jgi:hypothetical protein